MTDGEDAWEGMFNQLLAQVALTPASATSHRTTGWLFNASTTPLLQRVLGSITSLPKLASTAASTRTGMTAPDCVIVVSKTSPECQLTCKGTSGSPRVVIGLPPMCVVVKLPPTTLRPSKPPNVRTNVPPRAGSRPLVSQAARQARFDSPLYGTTPSMQLEPLSSQAQIHPSSQALPVSSVSRVPLDISSECDPPTVRLPSANHYRYASHLVAQASSIESTLFSPAGGKRDSAGNLLNSDVLAMRIAEAQTTWPGGPNGATEHSRKRSMMKPSTSEAQHSVVDTSVWN